MQETFSRASTITAKNNLGERVQILSDKINNLKFGSDALTQKKIECLESNLDEIE